MGKQSPKTRVHNWPPWHALCAVWSVSATKFTHNVCILSNNYFEIQSYYTLINLLHTFTNTIWSGIIKCFVAYVNVHLYVQFKFQLTNTHYLKFDMDAYTIFTFKNFVHDFSLRTIIEMYSFIIWRFFSKINKIFKAHKTTALLLDEISNDWKNFYLQKKSVSSV